MLRFTLSSTILAMLVSVLCLTGNFAKGEVFTFRIHDLQGNPLIPAPGAAHRLQIFEQQEGVQISKFGERRTIQLRETDRGLPTTTTPTNEVRVNVPTGAATQALVFVFQRSDEDRPTATLPFLVMPQVRPGLPVRTHELDVAVPSSTRAAPVTKPCPTKCNCPPRCFRCFRR